MTWLTPWGGLVALFALLPLGARVAASGRVARARAVLRLPPPAASRRMPLAAVVVVLAGVAAAQPCLRTSVRKAARTDAAAFVVLDISRSMAASSAGGPTRLERAQRVAIAARAAVADVPVGVATLTDRVLPSLFPTADAAAFDSVVRTTAVEDPPPRETNRVATSFDALAALGSDGFFRTSDKHRAVLLVTDGESRPFDAPAVRSALRRAHVDLVTARVGAAGDRITGEPAYRPDPAAGRLALARLGGRSTLRAALGSGPTGPEILARRLRPLAPLPLLAALLLVAAGPIVGAARRLERLPWARRGPAGSATDA